MAAPQSKNISSCSPVPSRPTNPRNSEISNPMRRSFSGNPFSKPSIIANQRPGFNPNTPANSPSDYPQRNSIGRENIVVSLRDSEDKENSKDHNSKSHKVRSPTSSKGTKNFMSPTISATSKINASPRKKILMERNEPVRTSVSFSDGKGPLKEDLDLKPENGLNQKKEVSFDPTITYLEDKEALKSNEDLDSVVNSSIIDDCDSVSESVAVENDFVNLDPSFKISPRASCSLPSPALAPLDEDPLMPPYDPKTNYLSPRPQFLHYKPNPRIEYLNKERDGKQLEDSFASESSSDAEVTEEETVSNEIYSDSPKESDNAASEDAMTEEEEELLVSEPNPINTFEGAVEARKVLRLHFLTRTKFTALLFVLAIAGLWASVSNSPVMDPSVLNNLNFPNLYVPPEISLFTRDHLEGLAQKFRQWLLNSLSYIHNLIVSFIERHKPSPLQFANLTILLEDSTVNYLMVDHSNFGAEVKYERKGEVGAKSSEEEGADEKVEQVAEIQSSQEEDGEPVESDENIEEDFKGDSDDQEIEDQEVIVAPEDNFEVSVVHAVPESEEDFEGDSNETYANTEEIADNKDQEIEDQEVIVVPDNFEVSVVHTVPESEEEIMMTQPEVTQERVDTAVLQSNTDVIEQPVPILKAAEIEAEVSDLKQTLVEIVVSSVEIESTKAEFKPESLELDAVKMEPQSAGSVDMAVDGIKNLLSKQAMMGISLTVLSVLTAVLFMYMKIRTSAAPNAAIRVDKVPIAGKVDQTPLQVTPGVTFQERSSSRHWQMEVETLGESCPSEMSSFQYSSSYSKQEQKGTSEAQSHERRPISNFRRESLASSDCSMGSASYGSFTTYEKLHIKHGNGDVECITPVRRSSRIRNQVTSP